jgi:methyl-accepting chemotaxis protein
VTSTQLKLPGQDELAGIGRTVNGMNERLSDLVGEIRNSAARVNMAGTQVAEGSQRLSQRTEEQASSLRSRWSRSTSSAPRRRATPRPHANSTG